MAKKYNVNVSNEGEIRGTISAEQEVRGSLLETVLRGYSAYELAVKNGFVGTMEEWIASLKGDIGPTPDVQIGDVVTGEPGTDASASMTGTPEEPILNLTIPRGNVGATPDIQVGDVVTGLPGSDASASMTGTPEEPILNLTIPRGDKGEHGEDAVNPVVSSSKDGGVTTVEITDATHTETLTINDGYTPQKDVDYFDGHSPSITAAKSQGTTFIYSDGEQIGAVQDGVDGYTPRKNVDYFDGHSPVLTGSKVDKVTTIKSDGVVIGQIEDGYTPQKGIDYVDGNTPNITAQRNQNTVGIYADGVQIATISDGDDGHSPVVTASKSGKDTTILVDNTPIATISDGDNGDVGDPGVYVGENEPTDPDVQLWIDTDGTPNYDIPTGGTAGQVLTKNSSTNYDVSWLTFTETDPTVPAWAKAAQKPTYTAQEVGALPSNTTIPSVDSTLSVTGAAADAKKVGDELTHLNGDLTKKYEKPSGGIPASDLANDVIPEVPVQDVQINGTSVLVDGVANMPYGSNALHGVVKGSTTDGIGITNGGLPYIACASEGQIRAGTNQYKPIVPYNQDKSTFYGLAKAAGDSSQSATSTAVGTYTEQAKVAIQKMLGIYEAPWELIREDTFTNETEADHVISVDGNGNAFDLQDVLMMFETPQQETNASVGYYGQIWFYYGDSYFASEPGAWTQNAGALSKGFHTFITQKNNMCSIVFSSVASSSNRATLHIRYGAGFTGSMEGISVNNGLLHFGKVRIKSVTGTGHYKLYGRKHWL